MATDPTWQVEAFATWSLQQQRNGQMSKFIAHCHQNKLSNGTPVTPVLLNAIIVSASPWIWTWTCTRAKFTATQTETPSAAISSFCTSSEGSYHLLNDLPTRIGQIWHSACCCTLAGIFLHSNSCGLSI